MRRLADRAAARPAARRADARSVLRAELVGLVVLVVVSEAWKAVVLGGQSPHQVVITPALDALPAFLDQFALGMGLAVAERLDRAARERPAMGAAL